MSTDTKRKCGCGVVELEATEDRRIIVTDSVSVRHRYASPCFVVTPTDTKPTERERHANTLRYLRSGGVCLKKDDRDAALEAGAAALRRVAELELLNDANNLLVTSLKFRTKEAEANLATRTAELSEARKATADTHDMFERAVQQRNDERKLLSEAHAAHDVTRRDLVNVRNAMREAEKSAESWGERAVAENKKYDAARQEAESLRQQLAARPGDAPVPMVMHCPECRARHLDVGEFATKPHHTHSCQSCGFTWRPAVVPTVGVQFLPGFKNAE